MKKLFAILSAVAITAALTSCGHEGTELPESEEVSAVTGEAETTEALPEEEASEAEEPSERQTCQKTIRNSEKPEVIKITFSGECSGNIKSHARVEDLYGVDVLHSGVVGLVGIPIELTYDDMVNEPELMFTYDPDELRGVPDKNLIMLHYNEKDSFYDTVENAVSDLEAHTVSAEIDEAGVYLLADAFQWYSCWGADVSDYAYESDPTAYATDWEREHDTDSIMKLADKEWAKANAPDFHVSTAEQLASAVYYVNGISESRNVSVTLESDIDLTGYDWKPMGWYGSGSSHAFSGTVDGKGHTINGMSISLGYEDCGFIGYGLDVTVKDITFTNASVKGTACTGIVGGEIYGTTVWTNVRTSGTVSGGGDDYAGIVGRETGITFKDCFTDAAVNGEVSNYPSYRQKVVAETEVVETFSLTLNDDYTITRDDHDGFQTLTWHIELDGVQVLRRLAEKENVLETQYQWLKGSSGKHTVYLVAYINGQYIRVSNIIEYEL